MIPEADTAVSQLFKYLTKDVVNHSLDLQHESTQLRIFFEGYSQLVNCEKMAADLKIENKINLIPTEGEQLHYCFRIFFANMFPLAEQILAQAAVKAGIACSFLL